MPHEWNSRLHPEAQQAALRVLYEGVGFARSLLAYELPDGRLKLIDGHLRRDLDPDMEVDVEILGVNDDEARQLLLSIDPLAALAQTQAQLHDRLMSLTPTESSELEALWRATVDASLAKLERPELPPVPVIKSRYLVLIECRDESHQVANLTRFQREGLDCRALMS